MGIVKRVSRKARKLSGRPHELLYDSMVDAVLKSRVDQEGPWTILKWLLGALKGGQRSVNYSTMAAATWTIADPNRKLGGMDAFQFWRALDQRFREHGHMEGELLGQYDRWNVLALMVALSTTPVTRDEPLRQMLYRSLFLWSLGCHRMRRRNRRGKIIWQGYGFRSAGLRKLPWAWTGTGADYAYAKILGLPFTVLPVRRDDYHEAVDRVVSGTRVKLSNHFLQQCRTICLFGEKDWAAGTTEDLMPILESLRAQSTLHIYRGSAGQRFSAFTGPLHSRQTACTRAVLVDSSEPRQDLVCYPYRRDPEKKWGRNRKNKKRVGAGGGKLHLQDDLNPRFEAWNEAPDAVYYHDSIYLPTWCLNPRIKLTVYPNKPAEMEVRS